MAGLKHATKKRLAKTTTRKRTIQSGISAEYTENKKKLESVAASIKSLIKEIKEARNVWLAVAKHQKDFAEALVASLPADGGVRAHAKEVESTVRQLQRLILEDEGATAPHRKITSVLEGYLRLIEEVSNEYTPLETTYTEVLRYQKKVDKLSKKSKETALQRNMDKLTTARGEHDRRLKEVIKKQKEAYDKHEAVFQCAHHAFWIAHDKYAQVVNEATKSIRWESVAVREHLVNIDVSSTPKLTAIPRVNMLLPPEVREVKTIVEESSSPSLETRTTKRIAETVPSSRVVETVSTPQHVFEMVPKRVVETVPSERIVETVPAQRVVESIPTQRVFEAAPMQNVKSFPVHSVPMQTTPIQTIPLHSIEQEGPLYTRNAPAPIHIAHPARADVVHMVPTTSYPYQQSQPVVHLTPEKPSVSVSLPPEHVGPTVPTDLPLQPSAPPQSPIRMKVPA